MSHDAATAALTEQLRGLNVLVVEDNGLLCCVLEEALQEAGCTVVGPYTRLGQALAEVENKRIDVGLLDINLRGELVSPLADYLAARGVPFLLTSAYQAKDLPRSLRSAMQLRKPFSDDDLYECLAALVTRRPDGFDAGTRNN